MPALHTHTHMQLHTYLHRHTHTQRKRPHTTTLLRVSGWQAWAASFFNLSFSKAFSFFFFFFFFLFYLRIQQLNLRHIFPTIIKKKDPPGNEQPSSNRGRFCWGFSLTYILGAYRSTPPPPCVMSTAPNNVTSRPRLQSCVATAGRISSTVLGLCADASWGKSCPAPALIFFPPRHSSSDAHLSEVPTSMLLNQVSRKWLRRPQRLTCGGKKVRVCMCVRVCAPQVTVR